ncbi:MAG: Lrp/AsnC family transcriptional regulator [Candidatus Marsarchaeota archaeon]|jgi:DNA-binding Lrp family transcriptional regulator|nr:Lrp/AsnC family transcriptional regulator [Candidatus Marsarchaeota archaeon]MCL5418977.1 Lrp/AsnC family transcriptional regulator [Candidatus Marsarchaeota archaeon]
MVLSKPEKAVLRELCENSRISASELSRKLGISRYNAAQLVDSLEQKLKLRYTLELDYKKLGFSTMHALYLRLSEKPRSEALGKIISKSTRIQFFAETSGDFDCLAFAIAKDPLEYSQLEVALQASLIDYGATIKSAEVTKMRFGFVPLNNKVLELSSVEEAYKKILIALNENSRVQLNEMGAKLGIGEETLNYYVKKLYGDGVIKRFTAVPGIDVYKSSFAAFMNYQISKGVLSRIDRERHELYFSEPEELPVLNNIQEMWTLSGVAQAFMMGAFESSEQSRELIKRHSEIYKPDNPEVKYAEIKNVLVGTLPFRNLDIKKDYDTTGWPLDLI